MQVFSTREVHKALRVCPASGQVDGPSESSSAPSTAAPAWRPRWRTGGALKLTQALYTLQHQLDGQTITCQLLPNRDGSFAMSVRGQGLISCSTVPDCERLFQTAFPQVTFLIQGLTGDAVGSKLGVLTTAQTLSPPVIVQAWNRCKTCALLRYL